jgi:hypothetical protein
MARREGNVHCTLSVAGMGLIFRGYRCTAHESDSELETQVYTVHLVPELLF